MKNPRKIRNFLLMPKVQLRYVYYLLAINTAPLLSLLAYFILQSQRIHLELAVVGGIPPETVDAIDGTMSRLLVAITICLIFVLLLVIYGAVVVSHRFVGPMYVINRYIKGMLNGEYKTNRNLRKDDEMKETFDLLKQLAGQLQEKPKS